MLFIVVFIGCCMLSIFMKIAFMSWTLFRSKVNEDIHGVINVGLKTWQAKHDLQRYRSTPKWRPVKCPRQLDSVGCGYYVQKYIHEIVHNSSTSTTSLVSFYFNFLHITIYDLNSYFPYLSLCV
ncbi:hypothetical protein IC582_019482 [Cucumis melo]